MEKDYMGGNNHKWAIIISTTKNRKIGEKSLDSWFFAFDILHDNQSLAYVACLPRRFAPDAQWSETRSSLVDPPWSPNGDQSAGTCCSPFELFVWCCCWTNIWMRIGSRLDLWSSVIWLEVSSDSGVKCLKLKLLERRDWIPLKFS